MEVGKNQYIIAFTHWSIHLNIYFLLLCAKHFEGYKERINHIEFLMQNRKWSVAWKKNISIARWALWPELISHIKEGKVVVGRSLSFPPYIQSITLQYVV